MEIKTLADLKAFVADLPDNCGMRFVNKVLCFTGDETCDAWVHEEESVDGVLFDENSNSLIFSHGEAYKKLITMMSQIPASNAG